MIIPSRIFNHPDHPKLEPLNGRLSQHIKFPNTKEVFSTFLIPKLLHISDTESVERVRQLSVHDSKTRPSYDHPIVLNLDKELSRILLPSWVQLIFPTRFLRGPERYLG